MATNEQAFHAWWCNPNRPFALSVFDAAKMGWIAAVAWLEPEITRLKADADACNQPVGGAVESALEMYEFRQQCLREAVEKFERITGQKFLIPQSFLTEAEKGNEHGKGK